MYGVVFDLNRDQADALHPQGQRAAYAAIKRLLLRRGFRWVQGSVYILDGDDMQPLVSAIVELRHQAWFAGCVRDIRAFRIEQWSDFTPFMQEAQP